MKRILLLFFCLLLTISCQQEERDCLNFHTGTFEFETLLDGELVKTTFIRDGKIEIDYFRGKTDTSSVRWINDCEYIVQKLHPKSMAEEKAIHMKILSTDKNTYTFEYGLVGATNKERGTAKKIK
ncbi:MULTISPECIES: DNA topoisomerase IV [Aquimarina]|uniref:DNA topoisomerase IV n=1 Tax=Aquimarina algiphila TaxID=2047982 RepID=A0A554VE82_9FLAO|nr:MULTISPECIES: DNA topoisomerase IV [Aquimarina]TSE05310.1 DNA topoisomerase IV [Aquimarina algiphila]